MSALFSSMILSFSGCNSACGSGADCLISSSFLTSSTDFLVLFVFTTFCLDDFSFFSISKSSSSSSRFSKKTLFITEKILFFFVFSFFCFFLPFFDDFAELAAISSLSTVSTAILTSAFFSSAFSLLF